MCMTSGAFDLYHLFFAVTSAFDASQISNHKLFFAIFNFYLRSFLFRRPNSESDLRRRTCQIRISFVSVANHSICPVLVISCENRIQSVSNHADILLWHSSKVISSLCSCTIESTSHFKMLTSRANATMGSPDYRLTTIEVWSLTSNKTKINQNDLKWKLNRPHHLHLITTNHCSNYSQEAG